MTVNQLFKQKPSLNHNQKRCIALLSVIDNQYNVIWMYMVLKDLANLIKTFNTLKNRIYN